MPKTYDEIMIKLANWFSKTDLFWKINSYHEFKILAKDSASELRMFLKLQSLGFNVKQQIREILSNLKFFNKKNSIKRILGVEGYNNKEIQQILNFLTSKF